jgi:uncharacterized protein
LLRALIFFAAGTYLLLPQCDKLVGWVFVQLRVNPNELAAVPTLIFELELLIVAGVLTALFALYERRRVDSYGLPIRIAFGKRFWEGAAVGFVWPALVALGMLALGGMKIHGLAIGGGMLVASVIAWAAANVVVGLGEEVWFRGYLLQTLWKSLGFWPASIVIALWFASEHYFYKTGENFYDVASLIGFSLLVCYTVLRTGSLWFAVGMHAAFDFTQLFLIGTPNGSQIPVHRLLDASFAGPAWLTGGVLGTEASVLMYPLFVLVFVYVTLRYRRRACELPAPGLSSLPT